MADGRFRSDLYHRLKVYPIAVPPLREHIADLDTLSSYFLDQARTRLGLRQIGLHPQALLAMQAYDWPGNVRELEHLLMRASLKATRHKEGRPLILAEHLDLPVPVQQLTESVAAEESSTPVIALSAEQGLRDAVDSYQKELILQSLEANQGNWSATARQLKTDRANLNRLAQRLGIKCV